MTKFKKVFPFVYVIFGLLTFLYVRNVLKEEVITVGQSNVTKKTVEEVKPVDVSLVLESANQYKSYDLRKDNNETFDDFLEDLVANAGLEYEKTEYTYGTVYDKINNEVAPEGYIWKVYAGDEEVTYNTRGIKLTDGTIYKLVLSQK